MLKETVMLNICLIHDLKENVIFIYKDGFLQIILYAKFYYSKEVDFSFLCSVNSVYHTEVGWIPLLNLR